MSVEPADEERAVEALIIAGGLGSRLRPLTDRRPKSLLPVAGVPFLGHLLAKLATTGVRHVVLATSYRAADFRPLFGDGSAYGLALTYVREEQPLGTGGAIRHAASALRSAAEDPVVVLNGDQLSGHDIGAQVRAWAVADADVSLHLVEVADARSYGCVPTDDRGRVTAFLEKSPHPLSTQVNAGCYVFRRRCMDEVPTGRVVSVERETFPALLAAGHRIIGYPDRSYWRDVGTPMSLVQASADLVLGIATSAAYGRPASERLVQSGADVDPAAAVSGGSVVGPGALVATGVVVDGSVLMAGARIGAGAVVVGSVLGPGARVGSHAVLHRCAVGDDAEVGDRCELGEGTSVPCGALVTAG